MPRPHKKDFLNHRWDYTLLGDDFSSIDKTAQNLTPEAGTLAWRGYQYPSMVYNVVEKISTDNGPWWIPDEEMWLYNDLVLGILRKAYSLKSVPVIKDTLLDGNNSIEIIQQSTVHIPKMELVSEHNEAIEKLKTAIRNLVICHTQEKNIFFSEVIEILDKIPHENSFKIRLCLVQFPHRIWLEGIYHKRIHPVIVIPTNVFSRYHDETKPDL